MSEVATYLGQKVAVGLHWRLGEEPTGSALYKFGQTGLGFVALGSQIADTTDVDLIDGLSLSWLAGQLIKEDGGISAVVLPLDDGRHLGVHIERGLPLVEAERLFDTAQMALEWAVQSKRSSFADFIYVPGDFIDFARASDTGVSPQILPSFDTLAEDVLSAAPKVQGYRVISNKKLGLAGAAVAGAIALLFSIPTIIELLTSKSDDTEMVEIIPTVDLAIDMPSFASGCTTALRAEWPGVPGWDVVRTGCALPGAPRPFGDISKAVAWKEYARKAEYAAIPSSGIASARMAAFMFQQWPHEASIIEGQILAARPLDLEYALFEVSEDQPSEFRTRLENAFVSVLAEHLPQNLIAATDPAQPMAQSYAALSLKTSMEDAFAKALFLPSVDILAIENNADGTKITLDERRARLTVDEVDLPNFVAFEEEPTQ